MLQKIKEKMERVIIGLNSGTSADGIDAAIVKAKGSGLDVELELMCHETYPFPASLRARLLKDMGPSSAGAAELCLISSYLGELFSYSAKCLCKKAGLPLEEVDVIGLHGQTIYHHPEPFSFPGYPVTGTVQIGNPALVAERTGRMVVSDFRSRDMAAGGQGAPLTSYLDYVLFNHRARGRILLNIGGIANVTGIPASCPPEGVIAFDTGPGNVLIDAASSHFSEGKKLFDDRGMLAREGKIYEDLLNSLVKHPYFSKAPPKSLDKETFGKAFFGKIISDNPGLTAANTLATLTRFTTRTIIMAIMEFLLQNQPTYEEIIVSGGGAKNETIMEELKKNFPKLSLNSADDYPILGRAKEAVLYAFLANETVMGNPGNLPSATGAKNRVILGSITPGTQG